MRARLLAVSIAVLTAIGAFGSTLQPQATHSVWDGVYTQDQATRGDQIYLQQCVACHGPTMEGGEMAPGLADGAFKANWNGMTVGDLYDRIREGMPPDNPGMLSRQEIADILAQVLNANGFPPGDKELPNRPEMLKTIQFLSAKPE
jgi:mono/diheme cytochrome c family protein